MTLDPAGTISPRRFAAFYLPLVATSYLLTATNPLLAAALARTQDPATSLSGYGVAFALIGVIYAPLLVVQQVAAQRLLSTGDVRSVKRFTALVAVLLSGVAALVAYTPVGIFVFQEIVGVRDAILDEAMSAMTALWLVPALTGLRAFHQGRLVAGHRTGPIAFATGARTMTLAVIAFALTLTPAGAWLGGVAFTVGLAAEAILVTLAPAPTPTPEERIDDDEEDKLVSFSTPLMLNVMLWWSTPLIINSVLARTPEPDCSIAAFTVVEAVAWFLAAPVGQLQHASLALVECRDTHAKVRGYATGLAIAVTLFLGILAIPAVREAILWTGFRLDPSLLEPAGLAFPVAALYPLLYGHRQYYQGLFVRAGCTGLVGRSAVLRIVVILAAAPILLGPMGDNGARLGVTLAVVGLVAEAIFLELMARMRALPLLDAAREAAANGRSAPVETPA